MDFARDLELPGLPTRKRGIRSSMQIAIIKTFSRRAAFLAMLGPRVILSSSTSWQLWRKSGCQDKDPPTWTGSKCVPLDFFPELCCSLRQPQRGHKLCRHSLFIVLSVPQSGMVADTDGQEE